ncbi:MAG TPA: hypothetical protein LFV92_04695 [Rickettsia endosymbiont of Ceroptres masudai]|nr:hypothetical protein [Rickettsia endosymbiont of Ceroptres masudai]
MLDHGIHKKINNFSILSWIPRSSRGMTEVKWIHSTIPHGNDNKVDN